MKYILDGKEVSKKSLVARFGKDEVKKVDHIARKFSKKNFKDHKMYPLETEHLESDGELIVLALN